MQTVTTLDNAHRACDRWSLANLTPQAGSRFVLGGDNVRFRVPTCFLVCIAGWSVARPRVALAGMPSVSLSDWAALRIETLSFCLVVLLASAAAVHRLWNGLTRDFVHLPRLTYGKALAATCLWTLLLGVVLTMIAGARELLTPRAWSKRGSLYALATQPAESRPIDPHRIAERQEQLRKLQVALWTYAARHEGRFPESDHTPEIAEALWQVPGAAGLRYLYRPGLAADDSSTVLLYEPATFDQERFVLQTNGELHLVSSAELRRRFVAEAPP